MTTTREIDGTCRCCKGDLPAGRILWVADGECPGNVNSDGTCGAIDEILEPDSDYELQGLCHANGNRMDPVWIAIGSGTEDEMLELSADEGDWDLPAPCLSLRLVNDDGDVPSLDDDRDDWEAWRT